MPLPKFAALLLTAIVAFSACPQDLLPINNGITTEAHFEVMG